MTVDIVRYRRHLFWNWNELTANPSVDTAGEYLPWSNPYLASRGLIKRRAEIYTCEYVVANADLDWDWGDVSEAASVELLAANPDLPWHWRIVSGNATIDQVKKYDLPWQWKYVYLVPPDYAAEHPDHDWNWTNVSLSLDVTAKHLRLTDKWNWICLSSRFNVKHSVMKVLEDKMQLRLTARPSDWWYRIVWDLGSRTSWARELCQMDLDMPFFHILRKLPPELRELVCALAFNMTWIPIA